MLLCPIISMGLFTLTNVGTLDGVIGRIIQAFKSITTHEYHGVKHNSWQPFNKKLWH